MGLWLAYAKDNSESNVTGVEWGKENVKPSRRCHETINGESILAGPCNSFTRSFGLHSARNEPLEAGVQQRNEMTKITLLESLDLKDTGQLFSLKTVPGMRLLKCKGGCGRILGERWLCLRPGWWLAVVISVIKAKLVICWKTIHGVKKGEKKRGALESIRIYCWTNEKELAFTEIGETSGAIDMRRMLRTSFFMCKVFTYYQTYKWRSTAGIGYLELEVKRELRKMQIQELAFRMWLNHQTVWDSLDSDSR